MVELLKNTPVYLTVEKVTVLNVFNNLDVKFFVLVENC